MANARMLALRVLMSVEVDKAYANLALVGDKGYETVSGADKALLTQLVYGALSHQLALDYQLGTLLKHPLATLPVSIRNILRLGAYQILYLSRVPDRAAVDEAVNLARAFGHRGTAGLVNAVLRRLAAQKNALSWPDEREDEALYLAMRHAHPLFLVRRYLARLGRHETEQLLTINNEPPRFCIRVNTLKTSVAVLRDNFSLLGITSNKGEFVPEVLYPLPTPSFQGDLFLEGHYQVQGEASAMCGHYMRVEPRQKVVDLCAAPGGKTTHLATLMGNQGEVLAFDQNSKRLRLVDENARRLGLSCITTHALPALRAHEVVSDADRVLLDAPCTGFGVLRHKPDIRLNRQEQDIFAMRDLQRNLIIGAADLVAPGGILVYSVCTTEPEETEEIVDYLLAMREEFSPLNSLWGRYFWPHRHNIDGFFIVALERKVN
ncbi:MAG: 16S rRNA (cytosine(967)-C(5))-methyltransferase RsmB [Peptococcaceae bacterium]|nr:16S rRNA (cytosine(967)-C(5))-methyltransferase RsmB [Peptococcaceae bacterium]